MYIKEIYARIYIYILCSSRIIEIKYVINIKILLNIID